MYHDVTLARTARALELKLKTAPPGPEAERLKRWLAAVNAQRVQTLLAHLSPAYIAQITGSHWVQ